MSEIEWARDQEEAKEPKCPVCNRSKCPNPPWKCIQESAKTHPGCEVYQTIGTRCDKCAPAPVSVAEDPDRMHISGEVPVVDLKSANAVIDQERAENARLRAEAKTQAEVLETERRYSKDVCENRDALREDFSRLRKNRNSFLVLFFCTLAFSIYSAAFVYKLAAENEELRRTLTEMMATPIPASTPQEKKNRDY